MSLQIRLRHALGERTLELPPRTVDNPLVIGRAADADVQVPSINVAPRHSVLFIHEGHWVIQAASDHAATYVNSDLLTTGATWLQIGDVIHLGTDSNAPTLDVEPDAAAAGHTGYVVVPSDSAAYASASPAAPAAYDPPPPPPGGFGGFGGDGGAYAPAATYSAPGSFATSTAVAAPVMAAPAYSHGYSTAHEEPAAHHDPDHIAMDGHHHGEAAPRRFYTPKKQGVSGAAVGFGVVVTVVLLLMIGVIVYQARDRKPVVQQTTVLPPPPPPRVVQQRKPKNIFDFGQEGFGPAGTTGARTPAGTNVRTPAEFPEPTEVPEQPVETPTPPQPVDTDTTPPTQTPTTPTTPTTSTPTPAGQESTAPTQPPQVAPEGPLGVIEQAALERDRAVALLRFDDFRRNNPGVGTERLNELTDTLMDKLWWERIDQLVEKRNRLTQDIKQVEEDIKAETDAAYKKTELEPKKAALLRTLQRTESDLKEMGWEKQEAPPVADEDALAKVRGARNQEAFAAFKGRVLNSIRRQRQLPWSGE
jgi:hypothetical protein